MTRAFYRQALRILPLFLLIACVAELLASIAAWGAAAHVEIPDWEPTVIGLSFGVPSLLLALLCLREVVRRTRAGFTVSLLLLVGSVFIMLVAIALEAGLASTIAAPSTYDNLRDPDGSINTSPAGFLYIGLFAAIIAAFGLALPAYIYPQAINPGASRRAIAPGDEVDSIGEMLQGRHGPGLH